MLALEYKNASTERKRELLSEIVSLYNINDRAQAVQALAHCQAVLDCIQDEFAEVAGVSARTLRVWKKEHIDIYEEAFQKYTPDLTVLDVEVPHDEDVLEQVYQNMLEKISDKRTSAKDLATLLNYMNITSAELKQYAKHRGATMRAYVKDNEALLIKDEDTLTLTKAFLSESEYLYLGTERTLGNTENFLQMDLEDNLVRLELMTAGMLMYSLWNGTIHPSYVEMAETLRVLKMASGQGMDTKQAVKEFDEMDGRPKKLKPFKMTKRDCMDAFGAEEGAEIFHKLTNVKTIVDDKTSVKLPAYEDVKEDYYNHLKVFSANETKPLKALLAELVVDVDKNYKEKYKDFLNNQEEK